MLRCKLEMEESVCCVCKVLSHTGNVCVWSRWSYGLLCSPAAFCCVFVSAETSHEKMNAVYCTSVCPATTSSLFVCPSVSRCGSVKIMHPPERHPGSYTTASVSLLFVSL